MCSCSKNGKNQTSKEVISFLDKSKNFNIKGIGLFLIPDPQAGIYEFKKVAVEDITLAETGKRGLNCEAYMFIPYGMELISDDTKHIINSFKDLESIRCIGRHCHGQPCGGGCFCSYLNGCI